MCIEVIERFDAHGWRMLEIREVYDRVPVVPNDRIFGISEWARRRGLAVVGDLETGGIVVTGILDG